jgi:5-methylcytosine-specific restriction endonuclease McrA
MIFPKICSKCGYIGPNTDFYNSKIYKDGHFIWCKKCKDAQTNAWDKKNRNRINECRRIKYAEDPNKVLNRTKKWAKLNPDRMKNMSLKRCFGITLDDYREMFIKQEGKCAICGIHNNVLKEIGGRYSKNLLEYRLVVDHNHSTGNNRSLLCMPCNLGIGYFKEDKNILSNAIKYLEVHNE